MNESSKTFDTVWLMICYDFHNIAQVKQFNKGYRFKPRLQWRKTKTKWKIYQENYINCLVSINYCLSHLIYVHVLITYLFSFQEIKNYSLFFSICSAKKSSVFKLKTGKQMHTNGKSHTLASFTCIYITTRAKCTHETRYNVTPTYQTLQISNKLCEHFPIILQIVPNPV